MMVSKFDTYKLLKIWAKCHVSWLVVSCDSSHHAMLVMSIMFKVNLQAREWFSFSGILNSTQRLMMCQERSVEYNPCRGRKRKTVVWMRILTHLNHFEWMILWPRCMSMCKIAYTRDVMCNSYQEWMFDKCINIQHFSCQYMSFIKPSHDDTILSTILYKGGSLWRFWYQFYSHVVTHVPTVCSSYQVQTNVSAERMTILRHWHI